MYNFSVYYSTLFIFKNILLNLELNTCIEVSNIFRHLQIQQNYVIMEIRRIYLHIEKYVAENIVSLCDKRDISKY